MIAIGPMAERDNTRLESESYGEGEEAIPIVAVQDLSFRWSVRAPYVLGIGKLSIQRGERVFIEGPSGSGKTTLARIIAKATPARFATISAVAGGVADVNVQLLHSKFRHDSQGLRVPRNPAVGTPTLE
mgnify:CR=1 FL=1